MKFLVNIQVFCWLCDSKIPMIESKTLDNNMDNVNRNNKMELKTIFP